MSYKNVGTLLKEVRAPKISPKLRRDAQKTIQKVLKPTYFNEIPISEMFGELKKLGVVVLQEDNTEWSGLLVGSSGQTNFVLGPIETAQYINNSTFYQSYSNVMLALQWYKDDKRNSKRIEVTGYIT